MDFEILIFVILLAIIGFKIYGGVIKNMARIAGVDLPRDKRIEIGLTYVYGIGRTLSNEILTTSRNTEKQISQSINFSQKEHEAISANAEKMLVLRQKVQMIAELILELSEHSQQIGNTISVVDDIAEQTNKNGIDDLISMVKTQELTKEIYG